MYSASALNKSNTHFRSVSLQNFDAYKERESRCSPESVVTPEGNLLDYPELELRRNPPNVEVDNRTHPTETIITIDSANRPGTLVEVVQCLTELNLMVRSAQISSDGGWFVDIFNLEEANGGKVIDFKKLETIKQVLKIEYESEQHLSHFRPNDERMCVHTVIEMADEDRVGLLYDVTRIIARAGLDIKSLAAWTQFSRGALVLGARMDDGPLQCPKRIALLKRDLMQQLGRTCQVNIKNVSLVGIACLAARECCQVKGYIHHERRLHRLLLQEVESCGAYFATSPELIDSPSPAELITAPEVLSILLAGKRSFLQVSISDWPRLKYWRVTIYCKDRTKLFFDTLCTLADLGYEVYHASVVSHIEEGTAFQDFYIRPRFGEIGFHEEKAKKLKNLLVSSILRRAPHGLKVHVLTMDQRGLLCRIADMFKTRELRVSRHLTLLTTAE